MATVYPVERYELANDTWVREPALLTKEQYESDRAKFSGDWIYRQLLDQPLEVPESVVQNGRLLT
jgi:hypothetical protein